MIYQVPMPSRCQRGQTPYIWRPMINWHRIHDWRAACREDGLRFVLRHHESEHYISACGRIYEKIVADAVRQVDREDAMPKAGIKRSMDMKTDTIWNTMMTPARSSAN